MDVLQLPHILKVGALARLVRGTARPIVVMDGREEVMVVLSPAAFESVLLSGGKGRIESPELARQKVDP